MPECRALTNQLHVSIDGFYKPCCAFGEHTTKFPTTKFTPQEFYNSKYMADIKSAMSNGWHQGCKVCKLNEESGTVSLRQTYNMWCKQETGVVEFLDFSLNNSCNLTCRMCNSLSSDKWAALLNHPNPPRNNFRDIIGRIDVTKLKKITYVGGEPFITPEIKEVLEFAVEHQIGLTFDTNCTFYPEKYEQLLSQIPVIYASFSIDGTESVNDYIRHGSDYAVIIENLRRWSEFEIKKGIKSITTVVQAYNLHDLKNIKSLAKQYNMFWTAQHIENPKEFQIDALPPDYINSIKDEINTKFMSRYCYDVQLFKKLKTTTFEQDRLLGTDLSKVIPSLYNRINI